jgi:hypothetical protein
MVKELYEKKVEQKFESAEPEAAKEMADKRDPVEHVDCVGIYVLTLNKEKLVRHFELVMVMDAKKIVI